MSSRKLIVGAMALAATLGSGWAQARDRNDVQWSVTIGAPLYSQAYPVYSQPYPVYSQPYPVYPQRQYHARGYQQPTRWDRDGDGIPNRQDPVYNPRWDHDGDGIANWQDRQDDRYDDRRYRSR